MSRPYPPSTPWMLVLLALACPLAVPSPVQAAAATTAVKRAEAGAPFRLTVRGQSGRVAATQAAKDKRPADTGLRGKKSERIAGADRKPAVRARQKSAKPAGQRSANPADDLLAPLPADIVPAAPRPARARSPGGARPNRDQVQTMITDVSRQYGVERALVAAVVAAESNFNAHAVSPVGAVGLMQVMPATAADYGVDNNTALFDPKTNLKTGTRHLKRLLSKYGNDYGRAIMAYNAGEGTVDRTNSNVTYRETLDYTESVIGHYRRNGGAQATQGALTKVRALRGTLRGKRSFGKARRLLKRYLDPSLLSLKVRPTLTMRMLNPALLEAGPESRPMFELDEEDMR
jgi:soluble lytic murein transglycosylase-like protein